MATGSLQLYTLLFAYIDGRLLSEEASVTMSRSTGSQIVGTVAKGYAGESPGMNMCEMDITNAVPTGDFEFDAGPKMEGLIPTEIGLQGPGGKRAKSKGFIISDSIRHSLNSETNYDFKFRGRFPEWE